MRGRGWEAHITFRESVEQFRRVKAAHDALVAAKKPIANAWGVGVEQVDKAMEEQRSAMLEIIERAAMLDWCHPDELVHPATLLAEALRCLGWRGPVRRLGGNISLLFGPALAVAD